MLWIIAVIEREREREKESCGLLWQSTDQVSGPEFDWWEEEQPGRGRFPFLRLPGSQWSLESARGQWGLGTWCWGASPLYSPVTVPATNTGTATVLYIITNYISSNTEELIIPPLPKKLICHVLGLTLSWLGLRRPKQSLYQFSCQDKFVFYRIKIYFH